jgi:2-iminobutanoate/2-iminopropanoate deaminase
MILFWLGVRMALPDRREPMFGPTQGGFYVTTAEILEAVSSGATIEKKAMTALGVLNEAYHYAKPSSFSRGLRIELGGIVILLISGTASIDESGVSVHVGDFRAQCRRTFLNITGLLESEGATWKDIVRTTCYLRDIERDYAAFNEERTAFYQQQAARSVAGFNGNSGHPLPARVAGRDRGNRDVPEPTGLGTKS